jgi:predicted 3-demethylubiquinone-9 3-methyltransferase (glyoxalase superfamily)
MSKIQKITPFLWFDGDAEQAAELYVSLFDDSQILHVSRYGEGGPAPAGTAMVVELQLAGQKLMALNGGPVYKLNEAFSLLVNARDQEEVDRLWFKLTANGGREDACGWLKDRFGLSWQIIPTRFSEMMRDPDPKRTQRVFAAMMKMKKLDIAQLEKAYEGH